MAKDFVDISFVLDRSGSMEDIREQAIVGFNGFLKEQQEARGKASITLVQFDHDYQVDYEAIDIAEAVPLTPRTYEPRGTTALLDAIGRTINRCKARLEKTPKNRRPKSVIVVILTDGLENASQEYTSRSVNKLISEQCDEHGWEFMFLGANQDAIMTAAQMGMHGANALTFAADDKGTVAAMASVSRNIAHYRDGTAPSMAFSEEDRGEQRRRSGGQQK